MNSSNYRWLFWTLAISGLILDQASKYVVFSALNNGNRENAVEVIPGAFRLLVQFTEEKDTSGGVLSWARTWSGDMLPRVNRGALFGLGSRTDWANDANRLFALISVIAAAAIIYWSSRPHTAGDRLLCLALGLILAGTLGNLYDRVIFNGVRDFLYWDYLVDWPVFNIADCCLVCGASLLLLQAFLRPQPVENPSAVVSEASVAE